MLFQKVLDRIKEIEKNANREKLVYKTNEYTYSFESFQIIKTFGEDIYDGTMTLEKANDYQTNKSRTKKLRKLKKKKRKRNCSSKLA